MSLLRQHAVLQHRRQIPAHLMTSLKDGNHLYTLGSGNPSSNEPTARRYYEQLMEHRIPMGLSITDDGARLKLLLPELDHASYTNLCKEHGTKLVNDTKFMHSGKEFATLSQLKPGQRGIERIVKPREHSLSVSINNRLEAIRGAFRCSFPPLDKSGTFFSGLGAAGVRVPMGSRIVYRPKYHAVVHVSSLTDLMERHKWLNDGNDGRIGQAKLAGSDEWVVLSSSAPVHMGQIYRRQLLDLEFSFELDAVSIDRWLIDGTPVIRQQSPIGIKLKRHSLTHDQDPWIVVEKRVTPSLFEGFEHYGDVHCSPKTSQIQLLDAPEGVYRVLDSEYRSVPFEFRIENPMKYGTYWQ